MNARCIALGSLLCALGCTQSQHLGGACPPLDVEPVSELGAIAVADFEAGCTPFTAPPQCPVGLCAVELDDAIDGCVPGLSVSDERPSVDMTAGGAGAGCVLDDDTDGYFAPGSCEPELRPSLGVDCDDARSAVHPHAAEACNAIDDDCDDRIDEGRDCDVAIEIMPSDAELDAAQASGHYALAVDGEGWAFTALHEDGSGGYRDELRVVAIDATGQERWSAAVAHGGPIGFWPTSTAIAVDARRVYLLAGASEVTLHLSSDSPALEGYFVVALERATGELVYVTDLGWAVPDYRLGEERPRASPLRTTA